MSINEYLNKHESFRRYGSYEFKNHSPQVVCADGFAMSVQASETHYCTPRSNYGPYTAVEIGFPNKAESLLSGYGEEEDKPTETVYGHGPVEIVDAVIAKHGGFAVSKNAAAVTAD